MARWKVEYEIEPLRAIMWEFIEANSEEKAVAEFEMDNWLRCFNRKKLRKIELDKSE